METDSITNKVVIVTGGSKGIGGDTAMLFAQRNAKAVVIADVLDARAEQTCDDIRSQTGCKVMYRHTDVSDEQSVHALFNDTEERYGSADILINCAGICTQESIEDMNGAMFDRAVNINLKGTYLCSREALISMKKKKYGKIVNFASISGQIGGIATAPSYAASKGGIISLTLSFAKAGAPYNVNVNAVAPGMIGTDMTMPHFKPENVPLGRIGTPRDVSKVVAFLASEESSYMTGTILSVNGGMFMYSL